MPTILTHAVVGATIAKASPVTSVRPWTIAAGVCAALPDLDVLSFHFGIPYGSMLGHRGITHSLLVACVISAFAEWTTVPRAVRAATLDRYSSSATQGRLLQHELLKLTPEQKRHWRAAHIAGLIFFAVAASHGLLDALTNGGLGVAFFAPFSDARYFFPWRPIQVSPIGAAFFSSRGFDVLLSEVVWVWIPSAIVLIFITLRRNGASRA